MSDVIRFHWKNLLVISHDVYQIKKKERNKETEIKTEKKKYQRLDNLSA